MYELLSGLSDMQYLPNNGSLQSCENKKLGQSGNLIMWLAAHIIHKDVGVMRALTPPEECISNIFPASKYQLLYCTV